MVKGLAFSWASQAALLDGADISPQFGVDFRNCFGS